MHEGGENLFENARPFIVVVVLVTGFMRAVTRGDCAPGLVAAKFPEDAIDEEALIEWGATPPAGGTRRRKQGLDAEPVFVGEVHYLIK